MVTAIRNFIYYNKTGYFNRKIMKWTNSFCIKIISCVFMSINYSSMAILFTNTFGNFSYLFLINSFSWIISVSLLYFEYRRKIPQAWCGLRLFWLLNGISYLFKLIFYLSYFNDEFITKIKGIILLFMIQAFFSMILLYFSIFKPKDYQLMNRPEIRYGDLNTITDRESKFEVLTIKNYIEDDFNTNGNINVNFIQNNYISVAEVDKNGRIYNLNDNVKNNFENNNNHPLLKICLSEIKSRKFTNGITITDHISKIKKIRFILKFNFPNNSHNSNNKKIKSQKSEQKIFNIKRSLNDIITFNQQTLEKLETKIKVVSPLKIQLKNITEILSKYNFTSSGNLNDYINENFSEQNDSSNSKSGLVFKSSNIQNNTSFYNKLKTLETIYVNLSRNFIFFIQDFLKFNEIKDPNIIQILIEQIERSNSNFNLQNSENLNRNSVIEGTIQENLNNNLHYKSQISKNSSRKNLPNQNDFYSEMDTQSHTNNDLIKTMTFLNNILTIKNYLKIEIKTLKEQKNLLNSIIECEMIIDEGKNNFTPILINLSFKNLIEFIQNEKIDKTQKIKELKQILNDPKNILQIKKVKNPLRRKMNIIFTEIVNNVFYLESELFCIFEINKLLNLEINEIDSAILNSFFELERKSSLNIHLYNSHILKEKNILNHKIKCEFDRIEKLETNNNSSFIVIYMKIFSYDLMNGSERSLQINTASIIREDYSNSWDVEVCLNELKKLFNDVLEINQNYSRFFELTQMLKKIIKIIDKLLNSCMNVESFMRLSNKSGNTSTAISQKYNSLSDKTKSIENSRISIKSKLKENREKSGSKNSSNNTNNNLNLIDEIFDSLNELFMPPYIYIIYSEQFRSLFKLHLLFDKDKSINKSNTGSILDFENSDHVISNSNKSILENLLS